jgi:hypothetical protein
MADIFFIGLTALFFAATWGLAMLCERLEGQRK